MSIAKKKEENLQLTDYKFNVKFF
ncbi:CLUMA_CG017163, isoform A [Clunio marinus]|uniref:CLUMA_CG017163, isoform A n=1 Tax=Clunio marinus TaxID=568069 RepID=A0A1J1IWI6_9DIPT|nr:CLUMA_CG017163, isoform A [Clunio marinus]